MKLAQHLTIPHSAKAQQIATGDLNRDGFPDFVSLNNDSTVTAYLGQGDGTFRMSASVQIDLYHATTIAVVDYDHDGIPDVFIGGLGSSSGNFGSNMPDFNSRLFVGKGDGTFQPSAIRVVTVPVDSLAIGDFDSDGFSDVVIFGSYIYISYGINSPFSQSLFTGGFLQVADFNHDGKPDLLITGPELQLALGNGDRTFQPLRTISSSYTGSPIIGDFDGDGNLDLEFPSQPGADFMAGNGDGTFRARVSKSSTLQLIAGAVGDFDGDGKLDIASPNYPLQLIFGDGGGGFSHSTVLYSQDSSEIFLSAAVDINTDGRLDLLVVGDQGIDVFLGGQVPPFSMTVAHGPFVVGQGSYYDVRVYNRSFTSFSTNVSVALILPAGLKAIFMAGGGVGWTCDVNSVSCTWAGLPGPRSDIYVQVDIDSNLIPATLTTTVTGFYDGGSFSVTDNALLLAPSMTTLQVSPGTSRLGESVTMTAGVDGTGKVLFLDSGAILGVAPVSQGRATLSTRLLPTGNRTLRVVYTGDSTHASSASNPMNFVVRANAASGFSAPIATNAPGANSIVIGDFDNDGRPDLAECTNSSILILLGNGDGSFTFKQGFSIPNVAGIAAGDFDGDGTTDLAVLGGSKISLLKGNGDGTFAQWTYLVSPYDLGAIAGVIAVSDFNNDGIADIVAASADRSAILTFFGVGDGTFQTQVWTLLGTGATGLQGLAVADLHADGVIDLVSGGTTFRSLGNGSFLTSNYGLCCGTAGDLDGDGRPELVGWSGQALEVFSDGGSSDFMPVSSIPLFTPPNLVTADVNGDGKLDVIAILDSSGYSVLFGNGDGTLRPAVSFVAPPINGLLAYDFNGDGLTDFVFISARNNNIYVQLGMAVGPALTPSSSHIGHFSFGAPGAYTLQAVNSGLSATAGTVTVTDALPSGISATSISGTGWTCTLATTTCTRSDVLAAGASYPPITLNANVGSNVTSPAGNVVTVSGGGAAQASMTDFTVVNNGPPSPTLISPADKSQNVSLVPMLEWSASAGATSYAVYFGTSSPPPLQSILPATSFVPPSLTANQTYYWQIASRNASPDLGLSPVFSFTTGNCTGTLGPPSALWPAAGGSSTVNVAVLAGCNWTASTSTPWITITSGQGGTGSGTLGYSVAANGTGATRVGGMTIAGVNFAVTQAAANATLRFVPVTPCRILDTRNANGAFGGPSLGTNSSRDFVVPASGCNIPQNAAAYSLNMTVVPLGGLGFLQVWPTGQPQPGVSTLNSSDGRIKANAAIVPAGVNGAITIFASNPTNVIVDINGYFVADPGGTALAFYPLNPCRIADTRNATGTFGGPSLAPNVARDFPILASGCGIPATAQAYALNVTAVPPAGVGFLSVWPAGNAQPGVSTLNDPTGTVVANAAIVPAGANGALTFYATHATNLIIDINGYFAPTGQPGALSFYPLNPCRIMDTRSATGTFGGPILAANTSRDIPIPGSGCGAPAGAKAYSLNATVVPPAGLGFLELWNTGGAQPGVSTLNASDGFITANAAIVPAGLNGSVTTFASNATHLILDINGYFAP